jgi:hypothetical protein
MDLAILHGWFTAKAVRLVVFVNRPGARADFDPARLALRDAGNVGYAFRRLLAASRESLPANALREFRALLSA